MLLNAESNSKRMPMYVLAKNQNPCYFILIAVVLLERFPPILENHIDFYSHVLFVYLVVFFLHR